ncbi:MAG: hypothetical protein JSV85_07085 [Candidatus Bathyarchaeota archaeon]|nr:MAG: hypothetical protein JSV85_07085 [Candidatus Bathyarchaeota archaeon]
MKTAIEFRRLEKEESNTKGKRREVKETYREPSLHLKDEPIYLVRYE